jgi:DNA polymerase I-like protein with 3'-5' exonuclease and polymerase domains
MNDYKLNGYEQCPEKFGLDHKDIKERQYYLYEKSALAVDTETTGTDFYKPYEEFEHPSCAFAVSACDYTGKTYFWDFDVDPFTRRVITDTPRAKKKIKEIIATFRRYCILVFHNNCFDVKALRNLGIDLTDTAICGWDYIHDTLTASHVWNSKESHGLNDLCERYLNYPQEDTSELLHALTEARGIARKQEIPTGPAAADTQTGDSKPSKADYWMIKYFDPQSTILETYAVGDVERTMLLWRFYTKMLREKIDAKDYRVPSSYHREHRLFPVNLEMQDTGMAFSTQRAENELEKLEADKLSLRASLQRLSGDPEFNPNSYKQKIKILFNDPDYFNMNPVKAAPSGEPSTDSDTIEHLTYAYQSDKSAKGRKAHAFLKKLQSHSSSGTAAGYVKGYIKHSVPHPQFKNCAVFHPNFNAHGTDTTRYSSSAPNAQNISKRKEEFNLRHLFECGKDYFIVSIDYSQLEARLFAHQSGDETMLRCLAEGGDLHQITADALGISRSQAKNVNFAWLYGAGVKKLSHMAGISAKKFNEAMQQAYPGALEYQKKMLQTAQKYGCIYTATGYRLRIDRNKAYTAFNYAIQGLAGDLIKNSMIAIREYIAEKHLHHMIHQGAMIHDELNFEVYRGAEWEQPIRDIQNIMTSAGNVIDCYTPATVSIHKDNFYESTESDFFANA